MNFSRHFTWVSALTLVILTGCGSPPPPPPSAAKDIDEAKTNLDTARSMEKMGQLDASIAAYERAKEAIGRGKEIAEGSELSQLNSMEDEARAKVSALRIKKINLASQPEKPKVVAATNSATSEDPEEKKKREADAIEKKRKAEAAKTTAALDATFQKGVTVGKAKEKTADDDEPAAKTEKPAKKEGDDDAAAAGGEAAPKGKPIKEAKGPFPAITEQSPEMEIVKLQVKGKYAIAYFQVYNKSQNGRRIMNQAVYFKNANGQEIVNAPSVGVYPYNGFKADIADPSTQSLDGLTTGSHQITGGEGMQFAAVGTSDSVSQCKSVGIIMVFDDGTKLTASGPSGGVDLNAGGATGPLKGLKGK
jgi:hypothetical protein